jgi:hypothetical protein
VKGWRAPLARKLLLLKIVAIQRGLAKQHARRHDPHAGNADAHRVSSLYGLHAARPRARSLNHAHGRGFDVFCNSLGFDLRFRFVIC